MKGPTQCKRMVWPTEWPSRSRPHAGEATSIEERLPDAPTPRALDLCYGDERVPLEVARSAWKIVGKAALALAAAYVFLYLMVATVIYLARVPDAASALIPATRAAPALVRSDVPRETRGERARNSFMARGFS